MILFISKVPDFLWCRFKTNTIQLEQFVEFKGMLGNYKIIETEDGTTTVHSEFFDENCHSTAGAYQETIYNYIEGCEISNFIENEEITNILEIGFGVAIGPECLMDRFDGKTDKIINFISTEIDFDFALWATQNSSFAKKYGARFENFNASNECISFKIDNFNFKILIGDARKTLPLYDDLQFHCIFQDAFSPKKNPLLWTIEWFQELKKHSKPNVILSSYSSHMSIRAALYGAGFLVESRKGFGIKRTCTRALLQEYKKLSPVMEEIKRAAHTALTDSNYQDFLKN